MSTREPPVPQELRLMQPVSTSSSLGGASGVVEQPVAASSRVPSPGFALAGGRVPGAPTLPDWDPMSVTRAVFQVANELFGAPQGPFDAPSTTPTTAPQPPISAPAAAPPVTAAAVPSSTVARASVPVSSEANPSVPPAAGTEARPTSVASGNPFFAPLGFGALMPADSAMGIDGGLFRIPFLDEREPPPPPAPEAQPAYLPRDDQPTVAAPARVQHQHEIESVPTLEPLINSNGSGAFDAVAVRNEFPILQERVHGKRLVWLDNAATTQKPRAVIDRLSTFYERENSNIHRAAHTLAARATDAYESARETTRRFLNAGSVKEIVFVRGATEGINLIAQSWGRRNVSAGDEIVITWLEHHANIVPWQMLCAEKNARLRVAPVDDKGQIILEEYEKLLGPKTRLVALPQVSNALGTVTPAKEMIEMAHRHGARVLLDGAQSVSHMRVDMQKLDCDFFVFSGHKVFAPTGIGAVYGKSEVLEHMPPWQGGGNMIQDVTFERIVYQPPPARFEAGTGNIADAVGLGAALEWLTRVGLENVERHEHELLVYATKLLTKIPGLTVIGTAAEKAGVLSFVLAGHSTADVAAYLDQEGIAVRGGHHCAQPILRRMGLESTVRASFAPYNLCDDVDALNAALLKLVGGGAWSK
ncbi:MAG: family 2A encapsulin nanocompartment cargo protein cysteine desulfurase [Deltaproteobacteria bacterium]|nr:family 2A encapsulin nanocompartment cargo protein cysteine desulfurase [Deltaproteobacteria bacterium]